MTDLQTALELTEFSKLGKTARQDLATQIARSLGSHYVATEQLVGSFEMLGFEHLPSGMLFVLVPGGVFQMGLSDSDIADAKGLVGDDIVNQFVASEAARCRPVHEVRLRPFLMTAGVLTRVQINHLSGGAFDRSTFFPDEAVGFVQSTPEFRLPSEAELEYVLREGGRVSFAFDAATTYELGGKFPTTSSWGFVGLTQNTWVADEWHDDYVDAPSDGRAWSNGGIPEVFRGDLPDGPDQYPEAVIAALAAYRGRWNEEQENEVAVRLCRDVLPG